MKHYGDITKLHGYDLPVVDCITGGSPCQDLSVAGKRAGLDGERSGLFMEQIRIIKEMRDSDRRNGRTNEFIRPRYMVWENVPGAFSSNGGEDFRIVLEETAKVADENAVIPRPEGGQKWTSSGAVMGDGWSIAWRVHDAQFWGVPQRRKRIALVADFGGQSAAEILFERKGVSGDFEESGEEREEAAGTVGSGVESASYFVKTSRPHSAEEAPTFVQKEIHPTLNGFDTGEIRANCYCLQGNGIDRADADRHAVCIGNGQMCNMSMKPIANTLDTMHDQQAVLCYGLDRASFNQGKNAQYDFSIENDLSQTIVAKGPGGVMTATNSSTSEKSETKAVVRRLTPNECERLQGYPDGWTNIGEWVDTKGKKHKAADSPRYKALGNSIALPFWFWLLRRISAQYERPATLGSLFDGIGGFPLCWERCNGKGAALWASEIEEFAIAVTNKRFNGGNDV